MKVFISWSGDLSKRVAELLSTWLEDMLQGVKSWVSTDDIDKGKIWFGNITKELAETGIGILCLTRENKDAPWVLFEAGALQGPIGEPRMPILGRLATFRIAAATLPVQWNPSEQG